ARCSGAAVLKVTAATSSVLCIFGAPLEVSATDRKVRRYGVRKRPSNQKVSGSPTWARTRDLRINSPSLYRLSYRGTREGAYHTDRSIVGQCAGQVAHVSDRQSIDLRGGR